MSRWLSVCLLLSIAALAVLPLTIPGYEGRAFRRWSEGMPMPRGGDRVIPYTQTRYFRVLKIGDHVQKGDLLALVDPTLAMDDLAIKASKFDASEADRLASEKT